MKEELEKMMRRMFVRNALKRLSAPSLGEVINHPEKWRIVRITNHGLEVVEVKQNDAERKEEA